MWRGNVERECGEGVWRGKGKRGGRGRSKGGTERPGEVQREIYNEEIMIASITNETNSIVGPTAVMIQKLNSA